MIEIADYDPEWPTQFTDLADRVHAAFADGPQIAVEHVGSTSVIGLAAKPILDLNVIVRSQSDISEAIVRLATLGYVHQGDLGIIGREAFHSPNGATAHHLYLCAADNAEHRRQVAFRDFLRASRDTVESYSALKRTLAVRYGADRRAYNEAKTEFIEAVLEKARRSEHG